MKERVKGGDGEEKREKQREKREGRAKARMERGPWAQDLFCRAQSRDWLPRRQPNHRGAAGLPGHKGAALGHAPAAWDTHRCPNACALKAVPIQLTNDTRQTLGSILRKSDGFPCYKPILYGVYTHHQSSCLCPSYKSHHPPLHGWIMGSKIKVLKFFSFDRNSGPGMKGRPPSLAHRHTCTKPCTNHSGIRRAWAGQTALSEEPLHHPSRPSCRPPVPADFPSRPPPKKIAVPSLTTP